MHEHLHLLLGLEKLLLELLVISLEPFLLLVELHPLLMLGSRGHALLGLSLPLDLVHILLSRVCFGLSLLVLQLLLFQSQGF